MYADHFKDKVALVSGSTAGIGYAIARQLAREGATVHINGRTLARIEAAVEQLKTEIPEAKVHGAAADFSKVDEVNALVASVPDIDILVNNVGIFEIKDYADITDADWFKIFEVNVMSGVRLSRHYFPKMVEKNWGRIIFISSESAVNIPSEMIHYGMTKTAQLAVSRGLAELTKGTNITVNSVLPGPTASEGLEDFVGEMSAQQHKSREDVEKEFFQSARPTSLLQRFTSPDEIANLVTFVASPMSSGINGAALRVDGGVAKFIV